MIKRIVRWFPDQNTVKYYHEVVKQVSPLVTGRRLKSQYVFLRSNDRSIYVLRPGDYLNFMHKYSYITSKQNEKQKQWLILRRLLVAF